MHSSDNGSNSKLTGTYTSDGIFIPDRIATPSELSRSLAESVANHKAVDISGDLAGENSGTGANGAIVIQINPEWELDPTTGKKFYPLPIYGTFTGEENPITAEGLNTPLTGYSPPAQTPGAQRQNAQPIFTGEENAITKEGLNSLLTGYAARNQNTGTQQQTAIPFTTREEFPISGAQTVQDAQATLDNIGKWLYDGEARDYLLNNIKKIGSMGLAGLEAAQGIAEDSAAGVEQIGSDVLNGLVETAGAVGNGIGNAVNYTAQGLTQAYSTIASPIAELLSNSGEVSAATDILLDIARSLEYLGTGSMSDFEAISDIQVSNLMEKLRNIKVLGFPLPDGLSNRLAEAEDALLDFSITKFWENSIEDRYQPDDQEKQVGKTLQKISAGLFPYIMDFLGIEGHPFNEDNDPDTAPENPKDEDDWLSTKGAGDVGKSWGSTDNLINSAITPGKGGVSPVGRAFQKHAGNPNRAGSFVGDVSGNATKNTEQGAKYVSDILSNPKSTYKLSHSDVFGDFLDVRLPDGTGARWSADGKNFIGFLEIYSK